MWGPRPPQYSLTALRRGSHGSVRFQVYRRYLNGETVSDLSLDYGIAEDRLEQRIRAAAQYWELHRESANHPSRFSLVRGAAGDD